MVCVNTVHMPSVYNVMLPERLHEVEPRGTVRFYVEFLR